MNLKKTKITTRIRGIGIIAIIMISSIGIPLSILIGRVAALPYISTKPGWPRYGMGSTSSGALIADVRLDIPGEEVIIPGVGWVRALRGDTGATIWERNLSEVWYWTQPQMADLNQDGIMEIIVPYGDWPPGGNGLYVLHANNGSTYWETQGNLGGTSIVSSPVVGDINGDGYPEIFVATEDVVNGIYGTGRLTSLTYYGEILHQTFIWRPCAGGLSLADGDHDGIYEIYMGDRDMYMGDGQYGKGIRSFWAENLSVRWNHPDILCSSQAPPLADVNGDGILDVIVSNQRGGVIVLDSRTSAVIRKSTNLGLGTHYQGAVYDVDYDGNLEFIVADGDHGNTADDVAVFDLVTWEVDARIDVGLCHYGPQVADVTGDGTVEIIATSFNGIHIIDPQENYAVIDEITGLGEAEDKLQNAVVQDIDGDGLVEIVVTSESGTVFAFDTIASTPSPRARTELQFYSERRLGVAVSVPQLGQEPEPIVSNPYPANQEADLLTSLSELRFSIRDQQGASLDYYVTTSPDIGSQSVAGVASGTTVTVPIIGPLDYYTEYSWSVGVTDGTYWTNRTYTFKTIFEPVLNTPPTHDNPIIDAGAGTSGDNLVCYNQTTTDIDGDRVSNIYNWYVNDVSLTTVLLPFDVRNATIAKDYSGYGNDAYVVGATWTDDGIIGGCYEFDGEDDYMMIPHSSTLGGDGTWSEITLEHWIYFSENQDGTRTISKIPSYEFSFRVGSNNRVFASIWTDEEGDRSTSTWTLSTGNWYHVVMTYSNDDEELILYVDGAAVRSRDWSGTIKSSAGPRPETREPVYIGWFDYFEGKIDEIRMYRRALTPEQIYQRYLDTKDGLSNSSTIVWQETAHLDEWRCNIIPNDGYADGEVKSSTVGPLANSPPFVTNLKFPMHSRDEYALTSENLIATYDYMDYDYEPESGSEIRWYSDGVQQGSYNDILEVPFTGTTAGETWYFTVRPNDGYDFGGLETSPNVTIIENSPPTQDIPLLVSSMGTDESNEELICYSQGIADVDGGDITSVYHWYKNDVSYTNLLLPFDIDNTMVTQDYSGYNNDGTVVGATWTSDGIVGGAYNFDGDDVITVEYDETLGGNGTWTEITVEYWVKTAAPLHGTRIIARKDPSASTGSFMTGFQTSGSDPDNTVFWGINNGDDWEDIWDVSTTALETGKWHHVVCTFKSGPGLTIYINGIERVKRPLNGTITQEDPEILHIGSSGEVDDDRRWLNGSLDEVRIYPVALSPAQVFQQYMETRDGLSDNSTIVPTETNVGDQWKCEVIPNDSWQDGTAEVSNILTVLDTTGNSEPRIDAYSPIDSPVDVNEGETIEFTHISSDADGDPLNYTWILDSLEQNTTQNWTYTTLGGAGIHNVTLKVTDGIAVVSHEWTVNVQFHDVAITDFAPSKTIVGEGFSVYFNVTVTNEGSMTENIEVTLYADTNATVVGDELTLGTETYASLPSGVSTNLIFEWNTTGVTINNYTITVDLTSVEQEIDLADNVYTFGEVMVTIIGDTDGNYLIDIFDVVLIAAAYNSVIGDAHYVGNADIDGDGDVDIFDIVHCTSHYGDTYTP